MIQRVTTQSGSIYIINYCNKTWHRIQGAHAAEIRTEEGGFDNIMMHRGYVEIYAPPIQEGYDVRIITSTPIVSVDLVEEAIV